MKRKRVKKTFPKIGRRTVKSQFEYDVWKTLNGLMPKGATLEYEVDKIPYVLQNTYCPDFTISLRCGRILYIETKGLGRAFDYNVRKKMIAVKEQNPDLDIRILFYRDGPIGGGVKMTASQWAQKYNFPYAVREIPEDWINE